MARVLGYRNAGTIEFLVDGEEFFFMEVNARIQVEHPVTETDHRHRSRRGATGHRGGEPLPIAQEDVRWTGAAIECRISAEDPHSGFLPVAGADRRRREPAGPGISVDSGL